MGRIIRWVEGTVCGQASKKKQWVNEFCICSSRAWKKNRFGLWALSGEDKFPNDHTNEGTEKLKGTLPMLPSELLHVLQGNADRSVFQNTPKVSQAFDDRPPSSPLLRGSRGGTWL